jgi:lipid II isoglutaminyl synthase (glutamine-hydrolysing)
VTRPRLRIGHLYAEEMNIYGDRGNVLTLVMRARWRGIEVEVESIGRKQTPAASDYDLLFWGGGQDREQELIMTDLLESKAAFIQAAVGAGAVVLAVCGGYQLLGRWYETAQGRRLQGLGLLDLHTVPGPRRHIGNVLVDASELGVEPATLVGFENHSGKTHLGPGLRPLGRVVRGFGNNGEDGTEGVMAGTVFGTYLHGSLLPKNPHLADLLIGLALRRSGGGPLVGLDDALELEAHEVMVRRLRDAGRQVRTRAAAR